ncbi:MAG TPA: FG-GAP-like repeat-containing protein [Gemmataceae bacterium]|nr:FG-GAP-like repeat-containing protein [Gemmataceae bacterium]
MRRSSAIRLRFDVLESREVPANVPLIAFGSDAGASPRVLVIERETGTVRFDLVPFASTFKGGVRVAIGDVTGDGQDDIIAATGPGIAPIVKVFDGNTGDMVTRFMAVAPALTSGTAAASLFSSQSGSVPSTYIGGVTVAVGDLDGDGKAEIITGVDGGGAPRVGAYDGLTGAKLSSFLAFGVTYRSGVRVAVGDLDGDGKAEIIAAPASGAASVIRVLDGVTHLVRFGFAQSPAPRKGGLYVATADVDGDGQAEIIVGDGASPRVTIHDGQTGAARTSFTAAGVPATGGARVGNGLISTDGQADILVGATDASAWSAYNGLGQTLLPTPVTGFTTGMWLAASPEQAAINRHASQVILDWNAAALDAIRTEATPPPKASRALAIVQAAVFDAVNGVIRAFGSYHVLPGARLGTSVQAVAAQAACTALAALFPNEQSQFNALLATSLASIPNGQAKSDGIAWGRAVAQAILAARANDGSTNNPPYTPGGDPGDWQPTPPGNLPALLPEWGDVLPFGVGNVATLVPAGPPALTSQEYADEFNEVKDLGALNSATRTADQTETAQFWADGAGTFTPPGHWNAIAAQLANADGLSLAQTTRLFAQLDIAVADAAIVCWKTKYTYNSWRPITAIQNATSDGNDQTIPDDTWEPLLTTPPFPEYTSGHSTFSGAASTILASYFGANRAFSAESNDGSITRSFTSFAQAADEAGKSRIYGGIHFQSANEDGLACGRSIGTYILANLLQSR